MALGVSQTGTMTSTSEKKLPPWLEQAFQGATGSATDYFGGYSSAPQTTQGLQGMTALAQNPGQIPGFNQTLGNFSGLMGGDYLHGGHAFNAAMDAAQANIQPRVQSAFNQSGRLNSGLAQEAMSTGLGNAFAGLYDNERNRQMQGLQMAPQMQDYAFSPSAKLYDIGQLYDNEPESNLDDYIRRLTGVGSVAGASTTESQPLYENRLAELLGLGTAGAGLIQSLFGGGGGGSGGAGGAGGALGSLGSLLGLTGDGGALSGLAGLFGFGGDDAGSAIGNAGGSANINDILGGGSGGSGTGLPPTPPGASQAAQSAFDALFGGGSGSDLSVIGGLGNTQPGASANIGSILAGGGSPLSGGLGALTAGGAALDAAGLAGISSLFGGGGLGIAPGAFATAAELAAAPAFGFGGAAGAGTTGLAAGGAGAGAGSGAAGAGALSGAAGLAIPFAGFAALGALAMSATSDINRRREISQAIYDRLGEGQEGVPIGGNFYTLERQGLSDDKSFYRMDGQRLPESTYGPQQEHIKGQGMYKVPGQDLWLRWDRDSGEMRLVPWVQTQTGEQEIRNSQQIEAAARAHAARVVSPAAPAASSGENYSHAPVAPAPTPVASKGPVWIAPNYSGEDYANQGWTISPAYSGGGGGNQYGGDMH